MRSRLKRNIKVSSGTQPIKLPAFLAEKRVATRGVREGPRWVRDSMPTVISLIPSLGILSVSPPGISSRPDRDDLSCNQDRAS